MTAFGLCPHRFESCSRRIFCAPLLVLTMRHRFLVSGCAAHFLCRRGWGQARATLFIVLPWLRCRRNPIHVYISISIMAYATPNTSPVNIHINAGRRQ
ncbi:hypothetical protein K437DRAFT_192868 [Tilletiaria anomala UBC 951]|uniref:Uncharacterized protein n=1 Tax=Tilletiaria anomala (strain ATCC 24038 / CBS 436.72 / UBC 951) TaxID=1037660 RepID=A0A066VEX9_TILAU|nr:uncharacterized protein K437DRAFT_192868 [Tilletiaria anomala UBC 951]KDN40021.1 hypothetical protein K437DRAFT_192868 [Tilletiaria anomala UBC 951]